MTAVHESFPPAAPEVAPVRCHSPVTGRGPGLRAGLRGNLRIGFRLFLATVLSAAVTAALPSAAAAHHGVAGLGVAGLEGPGAPIETATSATLPARTFLLYLKLDRAQYETFNSNPAKPESDYANYWIGGLGYGFTSWLSGYFFFPYNEKVDEPGGFDTSGFADVGFYLQLGTMWDEGLRLIPESESLDDLEDWHFTVFGGATAPTGDADVRDRDGNIDPGKSTGFGAPSYAFGLTATKMFLDRMTFNLELSRNAFIENTYDDGNRTRFGTEYRVNSAFVYRAYANMEKKFRLDLALEPQYLNLGRDRTNGVDELATGGQMLYLLPGVRFYWRQLSIGLGVKVPVWTELNEERDQQGGEGTEDYRFIFTFSALLP